MNNVRRLKKNAITNSTKDLCQGVRNLSRKFKPRNDTIKDENGQILFDGDKVKERWREYCSELNKKGTRTGCRIHFCRQARCRTQDAERTQSRADMKPNGHKAEHICS